MIHTCYILYNDLFVLMNTNYCQIITVGFFYSQLQRESGLHLKQTKYTLSYSHKHLLLCSVGNY